MSRLRCHIIDRRDEIETITFNRQLNGGPAAERQKLEEALELARIELSNFDKREARINRWLRLLEDSLVYQWIDNPDEYIKEWESKNEQ